MIEMVQKFSNKNLIQIQSKLFFIYVVGSNVGALQRVKENINIKKQNLPGKLTACCFHLSIWFKANGGQMCWTCKCASQDGFMDF